MYKLIHVSVFSVVKQKSEILKNKFLSIDLPENRKERKIFLEEFREKEKEKAANEHKVHKDNIRVYIGYNHP